MCDNSESEGAMTGRQCKTEQQALCVADRTAGLIDRLTEHALGTVELSATQLRAIELLLRTLPALEAAAASESEPELTIKGALAWKPPVA